MSRIYGFNPRRFERLLTILVMNQGMYWSSIEDFEMLYQLAHCYDNNDLLKNYPSGVKHRILMRVLENINGIQKELDILVDALSQSIKNRPFDQMSPIDRHLLVLGAFELRYNETAPHIIIKEILIISDLLGNQKAGNYLSGILKTLAFGEMVSPVKTLIKPGVKIKLKRNTSLLS